MSTQRHAIYGHWPNETMKAPQKWDAATVRINQAWKAAWDSLADELKSKVTPSIGHLSKEEKQQLGAMTPAQLAAYMVSLAS